MFESYTFYLKLELNEIIHRKIMGRKEKEMRIISWDSLMFRGRARKGTENNAKGDRSEIKETNRRSVPSQIPRRGK